MPWLEALQIVNQSAEIFMKELISRQVLCRVLLKEFHP
jgi:hypothetical protein